MAYSLHPYQYTLASRISCQGIGLHSGKAVHLTISPLPADSGLVFYRRDIPGSTPLPAHMNHVIDTRLATTLGIGQVRVATVEHLLAALHGHGIDNARIEVDGPEVPIMDGSARPFLHLLENAGRRRQHRLRRILRITRPISYHDGQVRLTILPHEGLKLTGEIDFDDSLIGRQSYSFEYSPENFASELAAARTFGYVEQVEELWDKGLAQGSSLANVVAIHWDRHRVLNEDGLRYRDEFVRHKVLDLLGDLTLLGCRLHGHVHARRAGHTQHLGLLRAILMSPGCWHVVEPPQHEWPHPWQTVAVPWLEPGETLSPPTIPGKELTLR